MNAKELMEEVSKPLQRPLCKDCKWFYVRWIDRLFFLTKFGECRRPNIISRSDIIPYHNVMGGKPSIPSTTAAVERISYAGLDTCGEEGKYFQPKKETT